MAGWVFLFDFNLQTYVANKEYEISMQCGGGFKVGFHFFCFNERACGVRTAEFTNQDQAGRESMFHIMTPFKTEQ